MENKTAKAFMSEIEKILANREKTKATLAAQITEQEAVISEANERITNELAELTPAEYDKLTTSVHTAEVALDLYEKQLAALDNQSSSKQMQEKTAKMKADIEAAQKKLAADYESKFKTALQALENAFDEFEAQDKELAGVLRTWDAKVCSFGLNRGGYISAIPEAGNWMWNYVRRTPMYGKLADKSWNGHEWVNQ